MNTNGFILESEPPTLLEAWAKVREITSQHYDPPLSRSEVATIVWCCKQGITIYVRCMCIHLEGVTIIQDRPSHWRWR